MKYLGYNQGGRNVNFITSTKNVFNKNPLLLIETSPLNQQKKRLRGPGLGHVDITIYGEIILNNKRRRHKIIQCARGKNNE